MEVNTGYGTEARIQYGGGYGIRIEADTVLKRGYDTEAYTVRRQIRYGGRVGLARQTGPGNLV